jgi:lipopolysaccharide transport system permease protein
LAGIIDGFRWAILRGQTPLDTVTFGISMAVTTLSLWVGISYFRRTERSFADVI